MKRWVLVLLAVSFSAVLAMGEDGGQGGGKRHKAKGEGQAQVGGGGEHKGGAKAEKPIEDLTLIGKLTKEEKAPGKDGEKGEGKTQVLYVLTDAQGTMIPLRAPKGKKDAPAINLDDYVNQDVTVVAKGFTTEKNGKKAVMVKEIVSINKNIPADAPKP